jgi:16S rRNA (guanine(966)-N(2))-methyltransferase RsmD
MRIVSGKFKGRRLRAPNNLPVRPTTDMAKEALFNILNNRYFMDELSVLDLFAGIGSISFEFSSRGCTDITSVDAHGGCIKFLEKSSLELGAELQPVKSDVFSFLERGSKQYDLIFADPPYDMELEYFHKLLALILERGLLKSDGMLIIEHGKQTDLSDQMHFTKSRKYGSNFFSFFEL